MATTIAKYVDGCMKIVEAKPAYVHGGSDLKECDCIGMSKYSFRINKVTFSTSGTNYSYRNQIDNARAISSASDLHVGDVVFKAYEPGQSGWDLPAKYQEGGSQYNGDLRDYCHIGTVKSVSPLQIIHMTSPTAKTDTKIGKWRFAGNWKKEYISDTPDPGPEPPEPEPPEPEQKIKRVWAESGTTVNMRKKPSKSAALVERVPIGSLVEVKKEQDGWSYISYQDQQRAVWYGWMMDEFLVDVDPPAPGPDLYTVFIPYMTKDQAQALVDHYSGAWMEKE